MKLESKFIHTQYNLNVYKGGHGVTEMVVEPFVKKHHGKIIDDTIHFESSKDSLAFVWELRNELEIGFELVVERMV